MYVTPSQARQHYQVSDDTLRRWAKHLKIKTNRTKGGHRRYFIPSQTKDTDKQSFLYARISSKKQENELQNQINFLQKQFPNHIVISDIGSGLNPKRKGFNSILDKLFAGNVQEVVVASKDRFTRFNFELFQNIFQRFNSELISLSTKEYQSPHEELSEDLMSIITVFSARYYGKRSYLKNQKDTDLSNKETKGIL
jgi:predicted site-specific integrase-resolvase